MALLTAVEIRQHIETDLSDTSLLILIDAEEDEIVSRFGAHTTQVDDLSGDHSDQLFLRRPAASGITVVEYSGSTSTTLASNDYRSEHGGMILRRLATGTNPASYWADQVRVTYTPTAELARRRRVLIDLVRLALANNALHQSMVGSSLTISKDYQKERKAILSTLESRTRGVA